MKKFNKLWFEASMTRLSITLIQCFIGISIISFIYKIPSLYSYIIWIAPIAGILSILMSVVFGLPEASTDGTLEVDTHDPLKDIYRLHLDGDITSLPKKKIIILVVDPKADLSHE